MHFGDFSITIPMDSLPPHNEERERKQGGAIYMCMASVVTQRSWSSKVALT